MATKLRKVLICDDETEIAKQWAGKVNKTLKKYAPNYKAEALSGKELSNCIRELAERHKRGRDERRCEFDTADVLIVDYRLEYLEGESGFVTGEELARLSRIYSDCGFIVVLNEPPYGLKRFDLTFKSYYDSFADFQINSEFIDSPGLWTDSSEIEPHFRPWTWPVIPIALEKFERRTKELAENFENSIFDFFSLRDDLNLLPIEVRSFIDDTPEGTRTFAQFVEVSQHARRSAKDRYGTEKARIRVGAARVSHWLERMVLPLQEPLIDAPHLATRFPSLVNGRDLGSWNRTVQSVSGKNSKWMNSKNGKILGKHLFNRENWITRAAWHGYRINDDPDIQEVLHPLDTDAPLFIFCEDISRFMEPPMTRWVSADLPASNRMRWVVDPNKLPARGFSKLKKELSEIPYEPALKFAM